MDKLKPSEIVDEVREVLENASSGKGESPHYLTAYQILDRLPDALKDRIISERGPSGKGAGSHYSSASLISDAAELVEDIEISYLDARGLSMTVGNLGIQAGFEVCGIYRISR